MTRRLTLATCTCALLLVSPTIAGAQRAAFIEGVSELTAAVAGTFGDEGPRIERALATMSRALEGWDGRSQELQAGPAFRAVDPNGPLAAYDLFRRASASGNAIDAQRAREKLASAYRRLLAEKPPATASRFIEIELLHDTAVGDPVFVPAAYARGYATLARGQYEESIAEFRSAAASDPLVVDPATRLPSMPPAIAALTQGRAAEARVILERTPVTSDSSETHRVLGLIEWADARDDKSIEQLGIAIRTSPRDERSRITLARVLSSAGRDSDAERILRDTIQANPDSAWAHWWLGVGDARLNRFADARRELELATPGAVDGRGSLYAWIGRLAANTADFDGAAEAFARAVNARPNDPVVHKYLAGALLHLDRADEAFVELVASLLIDPSDADAHAGIGQIHLNAGRDDEAIPALRRAAELRPDHTEARYALATALMRLGHTQEANREFEQVEQAQRQSLADRRRSMSVDVLKEEAALRAAQGQYEIAIADYEKAVALGAGPLVYRELAELYTKVGRRDDSMRAKAMYVKALETAPASGGTTR